MSGVVKKALGHSCRFIPLFAAGLMLVACDPPQKRALKELSQRGVEPSGKALLTAVQDGALENAKLLVQAGVHTGHCDAAGRTALHIAIERHDIATATMLLDGGSDVNAVDAKGASVLGYALAAGETAIIDKLLDAGARADGVMPGGDGILPSAIREGRLAFIRRAVESGVDPHQKDHEGNTLVHVAMESGRQDVMTVLLDRGADPAALDASGESLLNRALDREWLDLVPRLVKAGADPNAVDAKGVTPLEEAIRRRSLSLFELFLSSGGDPNRPNAAGNTAVHLVLKAKWPEGRQALAKAGADFNRPDANGKTPLALAMESHDGRLAEELTGYGAKLPAGGWSGWLSKSLATGDSAVVGQLLRMGVSADRRDAYGRLPVETAVLKGRGSMVKALLDSGAPEGDSLYLASNKGDHGMVDLLLMYGVSPNPGRAPWLDTPLGAALRMKNDPAALSLLSHGANPFLRTAEGQTPFHVAIALGRPKLVVALLTRGANPNSPFIPARPAFLKYVKSGSTRWFLREDRNVTPLMLAAASGEIATTRALLAAGAKVDVTTRVARFWPINFASNVGDVRMMRVLLGKDPRIELRTIVISLSDQRARIYNQFGEEVFTTRVSTGREGFRTPVGEYAITNKHRDWKSTLYHAQMPFFLRLNCGDFGLHQGVVPGYPASHGCIRVPEGIASKLFSMTETGDRVKIVP